MCTSPEGSNLIGGKRAFYTKNEILVWKGVCPKKGIVGGKCKGFGGINPNGELINLKVLDRPPQKLENPYTRTNGGLPPRDGLKAGGA